MARITAEMAREKAEKARRAEMERIKDLTLTLLDESVYPEIGARSDEGASECTLRTVKPYDWALIEEQLKEDGFTVNHVGNGTMKIFW